MSSAEVIYVEGLPGSGKTTLIGRLALRHPGLFNTIGEYVDPGEATAAVAASDETYFTRNDVNKYRAARASLLPCLVDRGHLSTLLYNQAHELVQGHTIVDVDTWYRETILGQGMLPDAYIHLDTEPITSLKRRPPAVDWINIWDDERALTFARQGYADLMAGPEASVPVLRLQADRMNFTEIDTAVMSFLMEQVITSSDIKETV
jgi:thymidylate kinase